MRPGSLLKIATEPEQVLDWLNSASEPFLVPDEDLGADLLFVLALGGAAKALVCVRFQFDEDTLRPRRDFRVVPVDIPELYKTVRFLS